MKHGTLLTTISTKCLVITCRDCGHEASLPVQGLIETLGHGAAVKDVLAKIRCRKCRCRMPGEVRLEQAGTQ